MTRVLVTGVTGSLGRWIVAGGWRAMAGGPERLTHDLVGGRVDGTLVVDEVRKPVHVDDLAAALLEVRLGEYRGVLNVAGADAVSRYELGPLVVRRDGLDAGRLRTQREQCGAAR